MNTQVKSRNITFVQQVAGGANFYLPILSVIAITIVALVFGQEPAITYIAFIAGSVVIGWLLNTYNNQPKVCFSIMLFLVAYLTTFIGLRDFGIGTDTTVYVDLYWDLGKDIHNFRNFFDFDYVDKSYLLLAVLGHFLSNDHQIMLVLTALVINLFTFLAVYIANYKKLQINWIIYILFWQLLFMNSSMNLMRQTCAQAIMLCSLVLLYKKKWIWGVILMLIAYNFHSSTIAIVPLFGYYLLDKYCGHKSRNVYTAIGIFSLTIIIIGIFQYIQVFIENGLINGHFDLYTDSSTFEAQNLFGVSYLTITVIYLFIVLYLRRKQLLSNSAAYIFIMIYLTSFVLRMGAFSLVYLSRLSNYYVYIVYFVLAYLLTKYSKKIPMLLQAMIYICIIYTWFNTCIFHAGGETYPYHSAILQIN